MAITVKDIVSDVQNILYTDKMYYIKCRNAKKIKKTLTKQEKSRYNSALLKQNAQAYDAVRLNTDILHEI